MNDQTKQTPREQTSALRVSWQALACAAVAFAGVISFVATYSYQSGEARGIREASQLIIKAATHAN